jgi:hypothetical protein
MGHFAVGITHGREAANILARPLIAREYPPFGTPSASCSLALLMFLIGLFCVLGAPGCAGRRSIRSAARKAAARASGLPVRAYASAAVSANLITCCFAVVDGAGRLAGLASRLKPVAPRIAGNDRIGRCSLSPRLSRCCCCGAARCGRALQACLSHSCRHFRSRYRRTPA